MAKVEPKISLIVDVEVVLTLDAREAAALDALVGYGIEPFLNAFYEKLGTAYLRPYENGLRSLFKQFAAAGPAGKRLAAEARKAVAEHQKKVALANKAGT